MIRIGIICPSEIAFRRFLPALVKNNELEFIGVAVASPEEWFGEGLTSIDKMRVKSVMESEFEKAQAFQKEYGGKIFKSYNSLIQSEEVDAIYLPLPPALHYKWAKDVLLNGKHLFSEKPFTTKLEHSKELIEIAKKNNLAFHENYMFAFHSQINSILQYVENGEIGAVRLIRIDFGFPRREQNDFRYNKVLGGGALLDCGGYPLKLASMLLGGNLELVQANSSKIEEYEVDIYGSSTLTNENGAVAQISFGMDNDYRCNLDIWGSKGSIFTGRILTAPAGFRPEIIIKKGTEESMIQLSEDDSFGKSMNHFIMSINNQDTRIKNEKEILQQAALIEKFRELAFVK